MRRKAVYAGSFDPVTNGHMWMIEQGAQLFDELIVALGKNPKKIYTFDIGERCQMLQATAGTISNVSIGCTDGLLVDFAKHCNAQYILRGIRNTRDFDSEYDMRHVNGEIDENITTIFLMPPHRLGQVSSSLVKELSGHKGWESIVQRYVPAPVLDKLKEKYGTQP